MYGGSGIARYQSLGLASIADVTYSGTTAATGTSLESVKTWGFRGGYTHNWNANWASAIYGAYAQVRYGNNAKNAICSPLVATSIVSLNGLTGTCNPDFNLGSDRRQHDLDSSQEPGVHLRRQRHASTRSTRA